MKRKIKGIVKAFCLCMTLTLMMSLTAFAESTMSQEEKDYYCEQAKGLVESLAQMSDEDMATYLKQNDAFTTSAITSWQSVKEELGEYQEIASQGVDEKGDEVVVTLDAKYANHNAAVTIVLDTTQQSPYQTMNFDVTYSLAVTMERAALNTIMGLGVVFLMLIFLSIVIAQFKHINAWEKKRAQKNAPVEIPAQTPVVEASIQEEELVDDGELVAVIAAAIAAAENTSTDGFVVRSIKKANHRKWQRA